MNRFPALIFCFALAACLPGVAEAAEEKEPVADSGVFVSEGTLDAYVGTYVVSPGFDIHVWREGEQMMLQATGQSALPLKGISETVFQVQELDAKVTFGENAAGQADQLVVLIDGNETKAVKR